jgi:hypothetical protein
LLKLYCSRSCHVKNFGTRDLRQANLPHRDNTLSFTSSFARPMTTTQTYRQAANFSEPSLQPTPIPKADGQVGPSLTAALHDPISEGDNIQRNEGSGDVIRQSQNTITRPPGYVICASADVGREPEAQTTSDLLSPLPNGIGKGNGSGRPSHSYSRSLSPTSQTTSLGRFSSTAFVAVNPHSSLMPTATGTIMNIKSSAETRYGVALTGQSTGGLARNWSGATPSCGRCGKSVYFAEQVKAVGKTYHKGCLRCGECNMLLDSTRLTEKDGEPLCRRCYGKVRLIVGAPDYCGF